MVINNKESVNTSETENFGGEKRKKPNNFREKKEWKKPAKNVTIPIINTIADGNAPCSK